VVASARFRASSFGAARRPARSSRSSARTRNPLQSSRSGVAPADIVVLRRVACCSPDGPALLGIAAGKARRTLLASYPRDRAVNRAFSRLENLFFRMVRRRFRSFVHRPDELDRAAARNGLRRTRTSRGVVWETAQFEPARS